MGLVQYPQKRSPLFLGTHGLRQLQIPPGVQIQLHEPAGCVILQLPDVGKVVSLQSQQGLQQCAAGNDGGGHSRNAHLGKGGMEVIFQQCFRTFQSEQLLLSLADTAIQAAENGVVNDLAVHIGSVAEDFAGGKAAKLRGYVLGVGADRGEERTGGNVAEGKAEFSAFAVNAADVVVFVLVQHTAFGDGTGGDDAGDVPLHQPLGGGRVFHLLADGDLVALLHQPGDVGVHAVVGDAAHGRLFLLGLAPVTGGQGEVKFPGRQFGVLVKHLVKVAQAEHQDAVLVLVLDLLILPPHGGQFIRCLCHMLIPSCSMFFSRYPPLFRSGSMWWRR